MKLGTANNEERFDAMRKGNISFNTNNIRSKMREDFTFAIYGDRDIYWTYNDTRIQLNIRIDGIR